LVVFPLTTSCTRGYFTTTSAQILKYGLSGWKLIPFLIASPHFNNLTSSKSSLALSASACCLAISTLALYLQISVRLPSSGKLNPIENPAFPL